MRSRWGALAGVLALSTSSLIAAPAASTAPLATACVVRGFDQVTSGHLDFGAVITGNSLTPAIKDDRTQPARWKRTGGMIVVLSERAKISMPSGYGWLAPAGKSVYAIQELQQPGVPWLGWNTQHSSVLNNVDSPSRLSLVSVRGPGKVGVFTTGSLGGGGERIFDNAGGPRSTVVPQNTHKHANWFFTEPGAYQLTLAYTMRTKSGQTLTGTSVINIAAGLSDPARTFSGCGGSTTSSSSGSASGSQGNAPHAGVPQQSGNAAGRTNSRGSASAGLSGLAKSGTPNGSRAQGSGSAKNASAGGQNNDTLLPDNSVAAGDAPADGSQSNDSGALNPDALTAPAEPGNATGGESDAGLQAEYAKALNAPSPQQQGSHWPSLALGALGSLGILGAGVGTYRWARGSRAAAQAAVSSHRVTPSAAHQGTGTRSEHGTDQL